MTNLAGNEAIEGSKIATGPLTAVVMHYLEARHR
jgi:hypothetical protein